MYYCANINNVNKKIRRSANYKFIEGNLQSFDLIESIFKNNKISHIIHFVCSITCSKLI